MVPAQPVYLPRDCQGGSAPAQISATGGNVWVQAWTTTGSNGSIAQLNARNGRLVRLISGARNGWDYPSFLAAGPDLWVTSQTGGFGGNGSVTEPAGRLIVFPSSSQSAGRLANTRRSSLAQRIAAGENVSGGGLSNCFQHLGPRSDPGAAVTRAGQRHA